MFSVIWGPTYKILTRGHYQEAVNYDAFGHSIKIERSDTSNGTKIETTQQYDALGQRTFISNPNNPSVGVSKTYDSLGRTLTVKNQDNTETRFHYQDNMVNIQDERNNSSTMLYRALGSPEGRKVLIGVQRPQGIATLINKNTLGMTTSVHQGSGNITGYVGGLTKYYNYDAHYYLTSEMSDEIGKITYGRDNVGNMTSRQVNTLPATSYTYDKLNRLTLVNYPNSTPDVTYTYDGNSNIKDVSNSISSRLYIRDANDNTVEENIQIEGAPYVFKRAYSDLDFLSTFTYPTNRTVTYSPDAFGRQHSAAPYVTNVDYHPSGQIKSIMYANGVTTSVALNKRLWSDAIQVKTGSAALVDLGYAYDGVGNITAITNAIDPTYSRTMQYDGMNRLTMAKGIWGAGRIKYDALGNISAKTIGSDLLFYQYTANRLATLIKNGVATHYQYDGYGNIKGTDTHLFDFDDAGNLRVVARTGANPEISHLFGYDADNYRVTRFVGGIKTDYIYGQGNNLLGEYTLSKQKDNIYLGTQLVATVESIVDTPPTANAGPDKSVVEGSVTMLDGSATTDKEGGVLSYVWKQISGPPVTLTAANTVSPTFTAPSVVVSDSLVFSLTVADPQGESSSDRVTINVTMLDADLDGLSDTWEMNYFGNLSMTAAGDFDGDTITNLEEFTNMSDPTVAMVPEVVKVLHAIAGDGVNIITWEMARYATGYDLYWSNSPNVTKSTGTLILSTKSAYIHKGVTDNTTYYYALISKNAGAASGLSKEVSVTTGVGRLDELGVLQSVASQPGDNGYTSVLNSVKLASNSKGKSVAVWLSDAHASASYSGDVKVYLSWHNAGENWTRPMAISNSKGIQELGVDGNVLSLDIAENGDVMVVWYAFDGAIGQTTIYAKHYSNTTGWDNTQQIATLTGGLSLLTPQTRLDANGNALVVWTDYYSATGTCEGSSKYFDHLSGWHEAVNISPLAEGCDTPRFEMNDSGAAIVAWENFTSDTSGNPLIDYQASIYSIASGWSAPVIITQPATTGMGDLEVAINNSNVIYATWSLTAPTSQEPLATNLWYREYNPIDGWKTPEVIRSYVNGINNSKLQLNDNGVALATWREIVGTTAPLYLSRFIPEIGRASCRERV